MNKIIAVDVSQERIEELLAEVRYAFELSINEMMVDSAYYEFVNKYSEEIKNAELQCRVNNMYFMYKNMRQGALFVDENGMSWQ